MWRTWPLLEKLPNVAVQRSRAPGDSLSEYQALMPELGITRLANITGLDCIGIPVVVAVRPASRGLATAQGKGITLTSAKVSALMEAIETWHAEHLQTTTRLDSFRELHHTAIDVTRVHLRSNLQFDPLRPIAWIQAHDLIADEPIWVPWEAVSCDFSSPVVRQATFLQSTNGLASGNHILEAIAHGLCEVIERDAVTLYHYAGTAHQAELQVDLTTVEDTSCRELLQKFNDAGVNVMAWDCTSDVGIPVLSALISDSFSAQQFRPRGPFRGYGCHPSRDIALVRAMTEAAQSRLTYISGSRDDLFREHFRTLHQMGVKQAFVKDVASTARRPFAQVPNIHHRTFNADIDYMLMRLQAVGLDQVAVFDLTRKELGVPVVKVLVPGLENNVHRSKGYRPGSRALRVKSSYS